MRLRREAPDPLYIQVKDTLVAEITSGRYSAHQRLPSERELSEKYKVSRMTARQALLDLAREGLIYTRVGKGTFVAEPKIDQQLRTVTGFSQDMHVRGNKPSSRVLEAGVVPATPEVAAALRLLPDAEVIVLARVRLADGASSCCDASQISQRATSTTSGCVANVAVQTSSRTPSARSFAWSSMTSRPSSTWAASRTALSSSRTDSAGVGKVIW